MINSVLHHNLSKMSKLEMTHEELTMHFFGRIPLENEYGMEFHELKGMVHRDVVAELQKTINPWSVPVLHCNDQFNDGRDFVATFNPLTGAFLTFSEQEEEEDEEERSPKRVKLDEEEEEKNKGENEKSEKEEEEEEDSDDEKEPSGVELVFGRMGLAEGEVLKDECIASHGSDKWVDAQDYYWIWRLYAHNGYKVFGFYS